MASPTMDTKEYRQAGALPRTPTSSRATSSDVHGRLSAGRSAGPAAHASPLLPETRAGRSPGRRPYPAATGGAGCVEVLALREVGFVVVAVNYRLAPQAHFPAMIGDVK